MQPGSLVLLAVFAVLSFLIGAVLVRAKNREQRLEGERVTLAARRGWGYEADAGGNALFRFRGTTEEGLHWTLESGAADLGSGPSPMTVWWTHSPGKGELVFQAFGRRHLHAVQRAAARGRRRLGFGTMSAPAFFDVLSHPELPLSDPALGERIALVGRSRSARSLLIPEIEAALGRIPLGTLPMQGVVLSVLAQHAGGVRLEANEHLVASLTLEPFIDFAIEVARAHQLLSAPVGAEQ